MTAIGPTLAEFHQKLSLYKQEAKVEKGSMELALIDKLLDSLAIAGQQNATDWSITYQQLWNIKFCCCPLDGPEISKWIMETIQPYCESILSQRKALAQNTLDFIHDYKTIKNKSFLPIEKYDAAILPFLAQLLKINDPLAHLVKTPFEKIITEMSAMKAFSKTELASWVHLKRAQDDKLVSDLRLGEKSVPRVHFPAGEYEVDPLFKERYQRYQRYQLQNTAVEVKDSKVLLHMAKFANEPIKEEIVEGMMDLTVKENKRYNVSSL